MKKDVYLVYIYIFFITVIFQTVVHEPPERGKVIK